MNLLVYLSVLLYNSRHLNTFNYTFICVFISSKPSIYVHQYCNNFFFKKGNIPVEWLVKKYCKYCKTTENNVFLHD